MKRLLSEERVFPKSSLWARATELPPGSPNYEAADGGYHGPRSLLGAQRPWWGCRSLGLPGPLQELRVPEPGSPAPPCRGCQRDGHSGGKLPDRRVAKPALISDQIPQKLNTDHGNIGCWQISSVVSPLPKVLLLFSTSCPWSPFIHAFMQNESVEDFLPCVLTVQISSTVQMVAEIHLQML